MQTLTVESLTQLIKEGKVDLKSTPEKLCLPVINQLYRKMKIGIKFSGIKVDGDLIIDGHHRDIASLLAGVQLEIFPPTRTSATKVTAWNAVEFVTEDWDTEAKILFLNKIDAQYNNITLEELSVMLQ